MAAADAGETVASANTIALSTPSMDGEGNEKMQASISSTATPQSVSEGTHAAHAHDAEEPTETTGAAAATGTRAESNVFELALTRRFRSRCFVTLAASCSSAEQRAE